MFEDVQQMYEKHLGRCEKEDVEPEEFEEFYDNWIDERMED